MCPSLRPSIEPVVKRMPGSQSSLQATHLVFLPNAFHACAVAMLTYFVSAVLAGGCKLCGMNKNRSCLSRSCGLHVMLVSFPSLGRLILGAQSHRLHSSDHTSARERRRGYGIALHASIIEGPFAASLLSTATTVHRYPL